MEPWPITLPLSRTSNALRTPWKSTGSSNRSRPGTTTAATSSTSTQAKRLTGACSTISAQIGDRLCRDGSANERKRVHALLGRIIFTCYLIDREIIYLRDYPFIRSKGVTTLLDLFEQYGPQQAKELLYQLFAQLREDFNGSMFDDNLDAERQSISDNDIDALKRFFRGEQLQSGQRTFGFWAYDFSIIPVETISAIYEKFLEEEDASGKEATGAFYTPKHLAEMVVNEAVASFDSLLEKRYLDPACGSGVFLVILFNRIAEEWQRHNPNVQVRTKVRELLVILEQKICGVDVNLTACRITCFSLYVAFLDQFDRATLRELQTNTELTPGKTGKILPKLLAYKCDDYKNTDTPAIFEGNFFNPRCPFTAISTWLWAIRPGSDGTNRPTSRSKIGSSASTTRILGPAEGTGKTHRRLSATTADRACVSVEGPYLHEGDNKHV